MTAAFPDPLRAPATVADRRYSQIRTVRLRPSHCHRRSAWYSARVMPQHLLIMTLLASTLSSALAGQAALPEPATLPARKELPDPLVMLDGRTVTTKRQWINERRPELKRL